LGLFVMFWLTDRDAVSESRRTAAKQAVEGKK